jgi:small-conductance mechanosensitive channel
MSKTTHKVYLFIFLVLTGSLLVGCSALQSPSPGGPGFGQAPGVSAEPVETQILNLPTPRPTATPGIIHRTVDQVATSLGLERTRFLGLYAEDWFNLGVSLGIVLLGFTVIAQLVILLIRKAAQWALGPPQQQLVRQLEPQIRWLVGTLITQSTVQQLSFVDANVKYLLDMVFATLYVLVAYLAARKVVDAGFKWYIQRFTGEREQSQIDSLMLIIRRIAGAVLILIALIILFDRYGINIIALTTVLGIGGLAISLAAQDTVRDVISGFIIMLDQPFRIGDRIEIESLDTWGDVVDIGARTTHIRTVDNRTVIVPNSTIGNSQIVNYSYPDPTYRVEIELGVNYESDINTVRQAIAAAVPNVDGVIPDRQVDVLFMRFGASSLVFRVRWWISSYIDTFCMFDQANQAIYEALSAAGINIPFTIYDVNLQIDPNQARNLAQALRGNGASAGS